MAALLDKVVTMNIKVRFLNLVLSLALFCISFYAAWQLSATSNFFYSSWYEVLGISETITQYGPNNNNNKIGFEKTDKAEHVLLFSGIVKAIQNKGEGLKQLSYHYKGKKISLLTEAEVIHLQDVANLVGKFKHIAFYSLLLAVIVIVLMKLTKTSIVKIKNQLKGGLILIAALIILLLILGPKKIFYLGHELIFPNNHQWFFYYEESLMSTMMQAPNLFGPIAGQLLLVTVLIWSAALICMQMVQTKLKRV